MLKETETEETIGFCHILVIGSISFGGGEEVDGPPAPPRLRSRVARILQRGVGLFLKLETIANELDSNYYQS